MDFYVLGPLRVVAAGRDITPSAPKIRELLALLLLCRNSLVQADSIINELWGEAPPSTALSTLQTYIYKLRKIFDDESALRTNPFGYSLVVPDGNVDVSRFEMLCQEGKAALDDKKPEQASRVLAEALAMWRGPALSDVAHGQTVTAHVVRLEEMRLRALELRLDADLRLGLHREVVPELKEVTLRHPLHEELHSRLMIALHRSGRRSEALEAYRRLRESLVDELGLEPSDKIVQLHSALLSSDPTLDVTTNETRGNNGGEPTKPVAQVRSPRQPQPEIPEHLPPDISDFTGRGGLVAEIEEWLSHGNGDEAGLRSAVITGMPGVGKSALAIHVAHRVKDRYPDGQVYVGDSTGAKPTKPADALRSLLRAAGFTSAAIPVGLTDCIQLFRRWCAGRSMLFVFDNLDSSAKIAQALPSSRCAVIMTGQSHIPPGGRMFTVTRMEPAEAVEMVTKIAGEDRVEAELPEVKILTSLCDHLPLALRAAATRLVTNPSLLVSDLERALSHVNRRLDELRVGDLDVRRRYEESFQSLTPLQQIVFCVVGTFGGEKFSADEAAEMIGRSVADTETVLGRLLESHMIVVLGRNRSNSLYYEVPALARLYARECLLRQVGEGSGDVLVNPPAPADRS